MSLASGFFFPADFRTPVAKHGDVGFSQGTGLKTLVIESVREPNYRLTTNPSYNRGNYTVDTHLNTHMKSPS